MVLLFLALFDGLFTQAVAQETPMEIDLLNFHLETRPIAWEMVTMCAAHNVLLANGRLYALTKDRMFRAEAIQAQIDIMREAGHDLDAQLADRDHPMVAKLASVLELYHHHFPSEPPADPVDRADAESLFRKYVSLDLSKSGTKACLRLGYETESEPHP